jgi:hypothetical protein
MKGLRSKKESGPALAEPAESRFRISANPAGRDRGSCFHENNSFLLMIKTRLFRITLSPTHPHLSITNKAL